MIELEQWNFESQICNKAKYGSKLVYITSTHYLQGYYKNLAIDPMFPLEEGGWLHVEGSYFYEDKNGRSYLKPVDLKELNKEFVKDVNEHR